MWPARPQTCGYAEERCSLWPARPQTRGCVEGAVLVVAPLGPERAGMPRSSARDGPLGPERPDRRPQQELAVSEIGLAGLVEVGVLGVVDEDEVVDGLGFAVACGRSIAALISCLILAKSGLPLAMVG